MDIFASVRSRSIKLRPNHSSSPLSRSNTADYGSLFWTFNPNNHWLSVKLTKTLYSKRILRGVGFSLILLVIILFAGLPPVVWSGFWISMNIFVWIPYNVAQLLSMNRDALGFIIKSGEYWIKIAYAAIFAILIIILSHHNAEQHETEIASYLRYVDNMMTFVSNIMVMVIYGATDAIPKMAFKWKAFISGLLAFLYTLGAIGFQLLIPSSGDYVIKIKATGSVVSCHSLLANTCGTLALFLWKNVFDVIRNRDRCISITYRPYLRWEIPENDPEFAPPEIPIISEEPIVIEESAS